MVLRSRDEDALIPQMLTRGSRSVPDLDQEGDINLMMPERCELID